jgi:hypothetical protein
MNNHFISIHSTGGRIGRLCWVNSDLRQDHRRVVIVQGENCDRAPFYYPLGWWGSTYLCSPHPATPGEAW